MIKKYKQFNEGIKHLLVGPTKDQVEKDMKNKYYNNEITLRDYLQKCDKYNIPKPTKNDVLMKLGITDKYETDQINKGEDLINFIIDESDCVNRQFLNKTYITYELYNNIYYVIDIELNKIIVNSKILDMLYIFDIYPIDERYDLVESIFNKRINLKEFRFKIQERHPMFF